MSEEQQRASTIRPGWDVVIDPDDEFRFRVFNVDDDQLHAFVKAIVVNGVQDFRVVRKETLSPDPFEDEPAGEPWPDVGDMYIPV